MTARHGWGARLHMTNNDNDQATDVADLREWLDLIQSGLQRQAESPQTAAAVDPVAEQVTG